MNIQEFYEEKLLPDNDTLDAMSLFDDEMEEGTAPREIREYIESDFEIN